MLRSHFEDLRPICPHCRLAGHNVQLAINTVELERQTDDIIFGILGCSDCGAEYPIIDGLPIVVIDVRRYVQDNTSYLLARNDFPPVVESLIGDAAGPGTTFDSARQHLSSYVWDHWGEFDPEELEPAPGGAIPGAIARGLSKILELMSDDLPAGPILDIGCGAGRTVQGIAMRTGRRVIGIDLSSSLALAARRAIIKGCVHYPRRRIGLVFDRRRFPVPTPPAAMADIWICDAAALPFADEAFACVVAMNVLDCLADPRSGLIELDRVLKRSGEALLSVPFDWTTATTPVGNWLGGHSQRGPHGGNAGTILELLLSEGPMAAGQLRRKPKTVDIPWHVRLHERACMHYHTYGIAARCGDSAVRQ